MEERHGGQGGGPAVAAVILPDYGVSSKHLGPFLLAQFDP
jgi:hypothetical protein